MFCCQTKNERGSVLRRYLNDTHTTHPMEWRWRQSKTVNCFHAFIQTNKQTRTAEPNWRNQSKKMENRVKKTDLTSWRERHTITHEYFWFCAEFACFVKIKAPRQTEYEARQFREQCEIVWKKKNLSPILPVDCLYIQNSWMVRFTANVKQFLVCAGVSLKDWSVCNTYNPISQLNSSVNSWFHSLLLANNQHTASQQPPN